MYCELIGHAGGKVVSRVAAKMYEFFHQAREVKFKFYDERRITRLQRAIGALCPLHDHPLAVDDR